MNRIFTIAFFACAVATMAPVHAQLPDEYKFRKEKEAQKASDEKKVADTKATDTKGADTKATDTKGADTSGADPNGAAKKAAVGKDATTNETKAQRTAPSSAPPGAQTRAAAAAKPKTPWRGWSDRAIVSLNGGMQSASFTLHDTRTFTPTTPGDREARTMTADYAVESGVSLDLGGAVRVWKGLGAGVAVTRFEDPRDVAISGTVPHPFFFNQARPLEGVIAGAREELAVHVSAVWVVPAGRRLQIALFGGPTFYSVKQTVVTDFTFSESYPYDSVTLAQLLADEESSSVTGFNVGADVGFYFTDLIGVGGILRFGRATFDSTLGSLDIGGPSFGVGLRLRIPQAGQARRPAPPPPPPGTAPRK